MDLIHIFWGGCSWYLFHIFGHDEPQLDQPGCFLAAYKGHAECVGLLIEAGANPDLTTLEGGSAPLHMAARSGHVEVVRLLIAAGVDRDKAKSDGGATPLHMAAEKGHVSVVHLLIAAGVDVNKKKEDGATPLDSVAWKCKNEAAKLQVAHLLIEAGVVIVKPVPRRFALYGAALLNQHDLQAELSPQSQRWIQIECVDKASRQKLLARGASMFACSCMLLYVQRCFFPSH